MGDVDWIGARGEFNAAAKLSGTPPGWAKPCFRPILLGEKQGGVDLLVELKGLVGTSPFFFAQVKTTQKSYTKRRKTPRLRVGVTLSTLRRMAGFPAPAYVVGVPDTDERVYIVSVPAGATRAIPSFSTAYELTPTNLGRLWEEVRAFWAARDMRLLNSIFSDE